MSSTAPATLCPGTAQSLQAPRRRAGPFSPAAGNTWDRNPCLRTSVAMARLGMLRTPTVIIDTAKRKVSKYRLDCLQEDKAFLPLTVRRGVAVPSRHGELIAQPIARRAATLFFPRGSRAPCHYGTARGVRGAQHTHTHTQLLTAGNTWDRDIFLRRLPPAACMGNSCGSVLPARRHWSGELAAQRAVSATRRVLLPASVTRRCRVRPSLCTSDGGCCPSTPSSAFSGTLCRTTSMRTGEDNRIALMCHMMPLLR